tara:strand:- start:90 stop:3140 length:3051 start_codon:yes stop_codon:yes gene_type:complete
MPFVQSEDQFVFAKKAIPLYEDPETSVSPSSRELSRALFRQENIVGSFITKETGLPDSRKDNPYYDAYEFLTEDEKLDEFFVSKAIFADNDEELASLRKQIARERKDKQTIEQGGATSFIMGLPVALADPISLLTIGGAVANTYKVGKSILSAGAVTGSITAADSAIQEAALHTQQLTRTFGQSSINIGASALLGGVLGASVAKLTKSGVDETFIKELENTLDPEAKIKTGKNSVIKEDVSDINPDENVNIGSTVGAEQVYGDVKVSGKWATKLVKALGFDPLSRTITSANPFTRLTAVRLSENPIKMDGNAIQAAESLALLKSGRLAESLDNHYKLYRDFKKRTGRQLNRKLFNEEVARSLRTGKSDIPEVKASADFWRKELYDPLKEELVALKLLPEDIEVKTANNYLNRVWDRGKIVSRYDEFVSITSNWLRNKDIDLYEAAKIASTKVAKATGKEKKELEAIIEKAEFKKGKELELEDYDLISQQIAQRIIGSPDGRLPYDWQMGSTNKGRNIEKTSLRGPLRNRTFQIPDELVEDFLDNDIEMLGTRYLQNLAGDIELKRAFDDVNMENEIKNIRDWWSKEILKETDPKKRIKMQNSMDADIRDIAGMRDRIRGVYGFGQNNIWTRIASAARDLNYIRLLGGVTVSSLPDVARVFMAEGFGKVFANGLKPLIANTKTFNVAKAEFRRYGVGIDAIKSGKSKIIADISDYSQGDTVIERGLKAAANKFGKLNLLDYWTAGIKQLHAITMQTTIFNKLEKGQFDKRLTRLGIDKQSALDMWEQVKKHGEKVDGVWLTNSKNWDRPDLERMYGAAIRKESDRVIIVPGQEKPLFMSSELGKSVGQFRSFILSATQRTFIAGLQNQDHNAVGGFISLVGMGAFAYYLKQNIAGRAVSDDPAVWIAEGIEQGGAIGLIGEVSTTLEKISGNTIGIRPLLGIEEPAAKQISRTVPESLLGPTFGSLLNTTVAASNAISSGDELTDADIRALRRLIPLQNLFFIRKGFDEMEEVVGDL